MEAAKHYRTLGCIPGGTRRNFDSYGHKVAPLTEEQQQLLCDPQTSGGLLLAVAAEAEAEVQALLGRDGYGIEPIGELFTGNGDYLICVD